MDFRKDREKHQFSLAIAFDCNMQVLLDLKICYLFSESASLFLLGINSVPKSASAASSSSTNVWPKWGAALLPQTPFATEVG